MSSKLQSLLTVLSKYEEVASKSLLKEGKETKKLDPKAKVRNRGECCVPAEKAADHEDHFPILSEDQARNALAQVAKYTSNPPWHNGTLKSLQDLVSRKVHSKYPSIGKSKKKASLEELLTRYAAETEVPANLPTEIKPDADLEDLPNPAYVPPPDYVPEDEPKPEAKLEVKPTSAPDPKTAVPVSHRLLAKYGQFPGSEYGSSILQSLDNPSVEQQTGYQDSGATPEPTFTYVNDSNKTVSMPKTPGKPTGNSQIKQVQTALKQIGLAGADGKPLMIDGLMGPNTRFALQSFKNQYGMDQTSDKIAMYYLLHPEKLKERGYSARKV